MGASSQPNFIVSVSLKNLIQVGKGEEKKNSTSSYGCLWRKVMSKKSVKSRRQGRIVMKKRRARRMSRRRGIIGRKIERKVRTLKRLIPNADHSMGLDGLFRDTADYIVSLQIRVRLMQNLVNLLTGSDDDV